MTDNKYREPLYCIPPFCFVAFRKLQPDDLCEKIEREIYSTHEHSRFNITVVSGVGGGWIVNGKVDYGQGLGTAQIGHMWMLDPESGVLNELEQLCSGWAIGHRARQAAAGGDSVMENWNTLQNEFRARVLPAFDAQVEIVPAKSKEDVVVIGALCLG